MTNKEAIEILKSHISIYDSCKADHEANEAIRLAIKALEEKPQGVWIHRRVIAKNRSFDVVVCSNCQTEFSWDAETGISMDNYKICPNCDARMKERRYGE